MRSAPIISITVTTKKGLRWLKRLAFIEMTVGLMFAFGLLYIFLRGAKDIEVQFSSTGNWIYAIAALLLSLYISYYFVYRKKLYPLDIDETEKRINQEST